MTTTKTKKLVFMAMFTALISAGAWIKIPIQVCPFTLQFLFTTLAGLLLGSRYGACSVLCYIALGLLGIPVFAEGGGLGYIFQPTFGYMPGFALGAYLTGKLSEKARETTLPNLLFAGFSGLLVVYAVGMLYYWLIVNFYTGTGIGIGALFLYCFVLAVPGDILLCILSACLAKRLIPITRRQLA